MQRPYAKIILATILFSLNPVLFRMIDLDALPILATVNLIAFVVLALKIVAQRQTPALVQLRRNLLLLLALGVVFTANNLLFIHAIKLTTVANAVLAHYLAPVFVLVLGVFLIGEDVRKRSALALLLSLSGLAIILAPNELSFGNQHVLGLTLATASALFFALEIILKKVLMRHHRSDVVVAAYLLVSVLMLLPFVSPRAVLSASRLGLLLLFVSAVFSSALGITLFTSALRDVRAQHAGIISYLEPLGAILWAIVIMAELPAREALVGGALILAGTYLIVSSGRNEVPAVADRVVEEPRLT